MMRKMKWVTPLFAFGMLLALSAARAGAAEVPQGKGGVSGTVVDKDGNAVAGVNVRIFQPFRKGERPGKGEGKPEKNLAADGDKPAKPEKGPKGDRPAPVATAMTDAEGKFTMADVPAGKYVVMAMLKGQGQARQPIEVKAGETATVALKLEKKDKPAKSEKKPE
jgi:hypothetical protein